VSAQAHGAGRPYRISVFNHKGGVGKTTLTVNIGAALASLGRRVLLVDSDPQCNLTSYLVADEVVDDLLDKSDSTHGATIWSAVKPISEATGNVNVVDPIELGTNNLFLLPGDIRLAEFESDLVEFWAQCFQRKLKGFRGTTALSELVHQVSHGHNIDYVFYDSGPNIGPLNRAILLDCDYFIVPVACDLFSLRALKTLGKTLVDWIESWRTVSSLAPQDIPLLAGRPKFLGYIPEGFRVYGGRPAGKHSYFLSRIEREIHSQLMVLLRRVDPDLAPSRVQQAKLGEVKDYASLVPASQKEGRPIYEVSAGTPDQRGSAWQVFRAIATKIDSRVHGGSIG